MRAVKGSLGHSLKRDMANRKALARANGTSRRTSGWAGEKAARSEDQSAPIPEEITSELGGIIHNKMGIDRTSYEKVECSDSAVQFLGIRQAKDQDAQSIYWA